MHNVNIILNHSQSMLLDAVEIETKNRTLYKFFLTEMKTIHQQIVIDKGS